MILNPTDAYGTVQTPIFPIPVQNDISDNFDSDSVNNDDSDNDSDNQFNFLKVLKDRARKQDIDHEAHFRNKVLKTDIKITPQKAALQNFWLNPLAIYWTIIILYAGLLNN